MEYITWISEIIEHKKVKLGGLAKQIPTSLAVAQAAHETGYGKSYSAKKRNNHFGLTYKKGYSVFSTAKESAEKYLETLTENNSYENLQKKLKAGEDNPFQLLQIIAPIYAEDKDYAKRVSAMIRSCDLRQLDWTL